MRDEHVLSTTQSHKEKRAARISEKEYFVSDYRNKIKKKIIIEIAKTNHEILITNPKSEN